MWVKPKEIQAHRYLTYPFRRGIYVNRAMIKIEIQTITFEQILPMWHRLWEGRKSSINPVPGMVYGGGYDPSIGSSTPTFFGIFDGQDLVAVNSGFKTTDTQYRSRGLYVSESHRHQGLATTLLNRTIEQAQKEGCDMVWSIPRKDALPTYKKAGFIQTSAWFVGGMEFGPNCYVKKELGMFEYTYKNHFQIGYDGEWFNIPEDHHEEMQIGYGQCDDQPASFDQECRKAARLISENSRGLLPNLAFSGGVDSEIMVRIFMEEKLPFKITILKFENDLNLHDVSFAISYCEEHGLDYELVYLDVEKFFESDKFMEIADKTKCISPQIITHIWLLECMDELPVFGCGEGCVIKSVPDEFASVAPTGWKLYESEKQLAMYRYCLQTDKPAVPGFFRYTPALLYTFMNNQLVQDLVAEKIPGVLSTQTLKLKIYQSWFSGIRSRPKFHGFEKIIEKESKLRQSLINRMPKYTRRFYTEYDQIMRHLEFKLLGN